jgi:hypothetical protein
MFKVEIDIEQLQRSINEAIDKAIEKHAFVNNLPPLLTKSQFQEMLDIGSTKAAELLNREDFPVIRELGQPRILTHLLLQWLESHTEWVDRNAGDRWHKKRPGGAA